MNNRRKAPAWQRIICALLATAAGALLDRSLLIGIPESLDHTARQMLAAYGGYLFAHIALTGLLPGRTLSRNQKAGSRK